MPTRLMQAVAMVLARQHPDDTPENGEFVLHVDSSAWRELGAALKEEQDAETDSTTSDDDPPADTPVSPSDGTVHVEDPFAS